MTERKFTDEEVIKALHICENYAGCCSEYCPMIKDNDCRQHLMKQAKDLINRQKELLALSEKGLKLGVNISENWERAYKTAEAEAIKEFAERLKKRERSNAVCAWCAHADIYGRRAKECDEPYIDKNGKEHKACFGYAKFESYIDNLAQKMTEGKPCTEDADCSTCENAYHDGEYNECKTDGVK